MSEELLKRLIRRVIKEAPVDDYLQDYPERMHPRTKERIEDPEGIYAKNKAFPSGVSDVERVAATRFKEIVDYVKRYYGTDRNITDPSVKRAIQMEQMMAVRQVMSIEPRHREALRDLAMEIASKEEGWMPYSVEDDQPLTMKDAIESGLVVKRQSNKGGVIYEFDYVKIQTYLGEKPINPNAFQMKPAKLEKLPIPANFSFDIDDLTPEEERQLEIEKRNVINALIQGNAKKGQFAYQIEEYKRQLDQIDPSLYPLYNKIMSANDLMYFTDEDLIEALGGNAAGEAGKGGDDDDDNDDDGDEKDLWYANGLIFPILVHELTKVFDMIPARSQWKGMDPEMASQVISQTDTMSNEPMNFRVGTPLLNDVRNVLPDELITNPKMRVIKPFFQQALYSVPAKEFLKDIIANVVSTNPKDKEKARKKFQELYEKAKAEYKKYKENSDDDDDDDFGGEDDFLKSLGI
jgi:hypothetical protein